MKQVYLNSPNTKQPIFTFNDWHWEPIKLSSNIDRWRKMAKTLNISSKAQLRLEWMVFYETVGKHNAYLVAKHFSITPKTFYKWHKRFDHGKVKKLECESTRPNHLRTWEVTFTEECRIKKLRNQYLHYGKKKIRKLYIRKYHEEISTWKIERVIKKHNLYPDPIKQEKNKKKLKHQLKKNRIQKLDIKDEIFFLFHFDTIVIYWGSIKRYILTACDHTGKLAYARMYTTKSSRSAKDFLYRLHYLIDAPIANIQTDNGSEFYAEFEEAIIDLEATHWFSRPRTPKDNAIVERFNQTLQDEWLNDGHFTPNINEFNKALTIWLKEYNFNRPHETLDYQTPFEYYMNILQSNNNIKTNKKTNKYLLPMYSARTKI